MSVVEVAFASSVVTGDFDGLMEEFHMGDVVVALSVTLMVCGFGIGPLFWSPMVRTSLASCAVSASDAFCRANSLGGGCSGSSRPSSTSSSSSPAPSSPL